MNKLARAVGVSEEWGFTDCLGLDPDLLGFIPQPCLAVLFLFPYDEAYLTRRMVLEERKLKEGQTISPNVFFIKQLVGNACGTIAVLHAISNNVKTIGLRDGFLQEFLDKTRNMEPQKRGEFLEGDDSIATIHEEVAQSGQTEAPDAHADVDFHFVSFVRVEDQLYELDGAKAFPINHGPTNEDSFLMDAVRIIQKEYIFYYDQENSNFSVITFGPSLWDD